MSAKTNLILAGSILLIAALVGYGYQSAAGKLDVKAGEEYYVCSCTTCGCETISSAAGKCGCGHDLMKAKVVRTARNAAFFKAEGWDKERSFNTAGKYVCGCGETCCKTVSQKPGKCGCGKDLKKVAS